MENKARKYCRLYKSRSTLAVTNVQSDLSESLVHGLKCLLVSWCLDAAENDDAIIDLLIPVDFQVLHDFTADLLSNEANDDLIIARAIKTLKHQNAKMQNLLSSVQSLKKCRQTEDVLILLSVMNARMGRDKECMKDIKRLSFHGNLIKLKSRLRLLSVTDLQLLRLVIESRINESGELLFNGGTYERDRNSLNEIHETTSYIGRKLLSKTNTIRNPNMEQMQCDLTPSITNEKIYSEVNEALRHLNESDVFLDEIIKLHLMGGKQYIASLLLFRYFNQTGKLPNLEEEIVDALHEYMFKLVTDLVSRNEKGYDDNNLTDEQSQRAVQYSKILYLLKEDDTKTNVLHILCLYQNGRVRDALSLGQQLLDLGLKDHEILRIVAYCNVDQGDYKSAIAQMDSAIVEARESVESMCVRGFALFLAGNVREGIDDVVKACKNDMSTTTMCFRNLKPSDQETIMVCINQLLRKNVAANKQNLKEAFVEAERISHAEGRFISTFKAPEDKNRLSEMKYLCEFVTRLNSKDIHAHLQLVQIYSSLQRYDDAQKTIISLIKQLPEDPLPMVHLANLRMQLGAYVASVEDFRVIITMVGSKKFANYVTQLPKEDRQEIARVHRQHGFRYMQQQSWVDAIECLNIAIIALGEAVTGLVLVRAFSFVNLHDFELALNDFSTVLDHEPDNIAALLGRSVMYAVLDYDEESFENLPTILCDHGETAIKVLQKLPLDCVTQFCHLIESEACEILERDSTVNDGREGKLRIAGIYAAFLHCLFHQSAKYSAIYIEYMIAIGQFDAALGVIKSLAKPAIDDPILLSKKSVILFKMNNINGSLDAMKEVLGKNKQLIKSEIKKLGITNRKYLTKAAEEKAKNAANAKRFNDAINYYTLTIMTEECTNVENLRGRFICFLHQGRIQEALEDLTSIINLKPSFQEYCTRAKLYNNEGKDKCACLDYIMALELDEEQTIQFITDDSMLKHVLCLFCTAASSAFVREQYQEVLRYCEFGLKLDPNHKGLRQLRYRAKCMINKCNIQ